jgi:hypothetical protein
MSNVYCLRPSETRKWRKEYLNKKFLLMGDEFAYKEVLRCTKKFLYIDLGRCLDDVKYKSFN